MISMYMTAYSGAILGPIAKVFGIILNWLYNFFEGIFGAGNVNLGFIIVFFTIVVNIILLPLTYHQQKFSNLQRKIQPELSAIQKKYKGKRDQASMMKQQEETQALYDKYGISMTGSCVQLLIQLPILYALYGVFNNLPAYITKIKDLFTALVTDIQLDPDYINKMDNIVTNLKNARLRVNFLDEGLSQTDLGNYIIDVAYKLGESGWNTMREAFPSLVSVIDSTQASLSEINYILNLNISDTPMNQIVIGWGNKNFGLIIVALLIPVFSYLSQVLNIKVASINNNSGSDQMAAQMQTMNRVMPLISLIFVFSVPVGLGLYWIAGAVIRTIFMVLLNRHFQRMDLDKIIEKNREKAEEKKKKRQTRNEQIAAAATVNTKRTMAEKAKIGSEDISRIEAANEARANAKPGSMSSKANLVAEFNKRNSKNN